MEKNKALIIVLIAALLLLILAGVGLFTLTHGKAKLVELSSGQAEYYEQVYRRYELMISTEEFLEYCTETDRTQANESLYVVNYDCSIEDFEDILPNLKELRYVCTNHQENYPEMLQISYLAEDGNEILVSYADNMVWEWMVYDAAENELINISDFKWVKYVNYK